MTAVSAGWLWLAFAVGWGAGIGGAWLADKITGKPEADRCCRCGAVCQPGWDYCRECWQGRL